MQLIFYYFPISFNIRNMRTHAKHILVISLCLLLCSIRSSALEKVVIDTDAGADDAVAILLTLKSEYRGYKVEAITCSYGNTKLDNVALNVLKTLTAANRSDVSVYLGAQKPLLKKYNASDFFGSDGLGDFKFDDEITANVNRKKHAAVVLIDLARQYPGQVTVLSLGPLTNVAIATTLDPSFLKNLKSHIILGSSVSGFGNVSPNVEFNFNQDPESNYIAFNQNTTNILFPWETALKSSISKDWRINKLGKINSSIVNFLNKAERVSLAKSTSWSISDGMAAAAMIWPEFIIKSIVTNVSPVIDGMARGSVLVDHTNITSKPKNTKIIQEFNTTAYKEVLLKTFS